MGKTKEELSLRDLMKAFREHSGLVNKAIIAEEESRSALRQRLDDQEANTAKIMRSTNGLDQFSTDVSELLRSLNARLGGIEQALESRGHRWSGNKARRRRHHGDSSDPDSDDRVVTTSDSVGRFTRSWSRGKESSVVDDTLELDAMPVRVLSRAQTTGSIVFEENEDTAQKIHVPKTFSVMDTAAGSNRVVTNGDVPCDDTISTFGDTESRGDGTVGATADDTIPCDIHPEVSVVSAILHADDVALASIPVGQGDDSQVVVAPDGGDERECDSDESSFRSSVECAEEYMDIYNHAVVTEEFDFAASRGTANMDTLQERQSDTARRVFTLTHAQSSFASDISINPLSPLPAEVLDNVVLPSDDNNVVLPSDDNGEVCYGMSASSSDMELVGELSDSAAASVMGESPDGSSDKEPSESIPCAPEESEMLYRQGNVDVRCGVSSPSLTGAGEEQCDEGESSVADAESPSPCVSTLGDALDEESDNTLDWVERDSPRRSEDIFDMGSEVRPVARVRVELREALADMSEDDSIPPLSDGESYYEGVLRGESGSELHTIESMEDVEECISDVHIAGGHEGRRHHSDDDELGGT